MSAPDPGHVATDKQLQKLIKKLNAEYKSAKKDLNAKLKAYMKKFAEQDAVMKEKMANGEIDKDVYKEWRLSKIMTGNWWKEMKQTISDDLTNTDKIAASIINGYTPQAYALNHNYGTYEAEKGALVDTTYTLYDRYTVERLFRDQPDLLPTNADFDPIKQKFVSVDIPKNDKWNKKHIQSAVLQGILQGESIPKIAERLANVTNMNANAAIRNARTAMTGAENAGRVDSYKRAESMGIKMKQMWVATLDSRTRDSHAMLDGEIIEVGKRFPNGCSYPGDPKGPPGDTYNCRCTLVAVVDGADPYNPNLRKSSYLEDQGLTYDEWRNAHDTPAYQLQKAKGLAWKSNLDLQEYEFHTYSNIWKNDVTEADYSAKKGAIQAKKDYFWHKYTGTSFPDDQQWLDLYNSVEDFEKRGAEYEALKLQAKADAQAYAKMLRAKNGSQSDAFTQDRKDNAKWFTRSTYNDGDAYYDPIGKDLMSKATKAEHRAYYEYTSASGGINRPLAGFEAPRFSGGSGWDAKYYKGPGNVSFDNEGKGDHIRNLTSLIEKSDGYPDDVWLQTGQGMQFLEGFLGQNYGSISQMLESDLQQFIGERREIPQFMSTAINRGGGSYTPGDVVVNIYCPSGSKMLYVQDDGAFRKNEHEMILQRGGTYEITNIYYGYDDNGSRKLFVDMDLHNEVGYNLYDN